jgi:predicted DCC family thiol-disulfide oxidoreductase YuxK
MELSKNHIILFDGVCNLCNSSVQFIIKHDKKDKFRFASLQSDFGKELIKKYQIDTSKTDSVIYVYDNKAHTQSMAALKIVRQLNGAWPILYIFIIVPSFIRNWIYNYVAKNRYKWFGKKESCMIPNPELKSRFLG